MVITVPSGQVGVLWKRFNGIDIYCWCWVGRGTVLDPRELREEGLHVIWPWDKLFLYDLRLQSATQTYNAISKDGVSVTAQISVRYQLLHNSVAVLHKFIGPDYLTSVIDPEIGSQARQVISQYTAQEVYTSRETIQKQIREDAQKSLAANLNKLVQPEAMEQPDPKHYNDFLQDAIQILDTLVLSIELPPDIVAAINRQTEQYYMIQEYKFRVRARSRGIETQTDRGRRHRRVPENGEPGDFGILSALARHRGDAAIGTVAECQDRDHRLRQGRPADHSRQCRYAGCAGCGPATGCERGEPPPGANGGRRRQERAARRHRRRPPVRRRIRRSRPHPERRLGGGSSGAKPPGGSSSIATPPPPEPMASSATSTDLAGVGPSCSRISGAAAVGGSSDTAATRNRNNSRRTKVSDGTDAADRSATVLDHAGLRR